MDVGGGLELRRARGTEGGMRDECNDHDVSFNEVKKIYEVRVFFVKVDRPPPAATIGRM